MDMRITIDHAIELGKEHMDYYQVAYVMSWYTNFGLKSEIGLQVFD